MNKKIKAMSLSKDTQDKHTCFIKSKEIYTLKVANTKLLQENIRLKRMLGLIEDECSKIIEAAE